MVAWLLPAPEGRRRPWAEPTGVLGVPLLAVYQPPGAGERRLRQSLPLLRRRGIRRVLAAPGVADDDALARHGLTPVSPLPLCRVKGAELALALLTDVPLRARRVALRGRWADAVAWALADALCPRTGQLLLDFDRGEEALARRLRDRYGAAALHLGQGGPPQVSLELSPRPEPAGLPLRLWGAPCLQGLTLAPPAPLPDHLPPLPFLELLWETGRVSPERLPVVRPAE